MSDSKMVSMLLAKDLKERIDRERSRRGFNFTKFVEFKLYEHFKELDEVRGNGE